MRIAIDTHVLAYAEGVGDAPRCKKAANLVAKLNVSDVVLPAQVLGELYNVLTRKANRSAPDARDAILSWADAFLARMNESPWFICASITEAACRAPATGLYAAPRSECSSAW